MNDWQSPKVQLPPQGRKILWFKNGDLFVAYRLGDKYLCVSPKGSGLLEPPSLWMLAPLPDPYEGLMRVVLKSGGDLITIDELELNSPIEYREFLDYLTFLDENSK